ncbi:sensor histidine kinase [Nakamurella sp.]|uniref:sensor histidine kinase n=1 Tax=Nakamurella sp. TaxID=1869182 RepID=UPI003783F263
MTEEDDSRGPARSRGPIEARQSLRLRLTLLSTALLALFGALLLALSYLVVGRVVAALPQFPPGTFVEVDGRLVEASAAASAIAGQGRQTVLIAGLIAFPIQVLAGAMLSWLLIGRTLRPLFTLTRTARVLSESSLDSRIRLTGPRDEVADLSDTFDDMLDRLQAAFDAERRFVANASHELRTPLSVIRTEVEVTLADPAADAAQLREMGTVVLEATDGANRLLTSLLVLARTQARGVSVRQEVDLAELVGPTLQVNEAAIGERGLSVTVSGGPAPVSGDPALLGRLIGNLVENAVRHNVPGGWITVTTGRADDGHGDSILEIASSGPVIDAATVTELFEPFRQGQRPRTGQRGTGLGLSIVRAVVAAHHGTVDAAPVPDGGLRVRVRLPPADPAPAAAD